MFIVSRNLHLLKGRLKKWCLTNKNLWSINWRELSQNLGEKGSSVSNLLDGGVYIDHVKSSSAQMAISLHYWRQRSKEKWLVNGDVPSKLVLYSRIKHRQVRKEIAKIKDDNGLFIQVRRKSKILWIVR